MITLSNLAEKSAQEVFDHVKNHLLMVNLIIAHKQHKEFTNLQEVV